jgi:hypothetical protein
MSSPWVGRDSNGHDVAPDVSVGDCLAGLALSWRIVGAAARCCDSLNDRDGRGWGGAVASWGAGGLCRRWSRWSGGEGVDGLDAAGLVARGCGPDYCGEPGGVVS